MDIDIKCSTMAACVAQNGEAFITVMNDAFAEQRVQHAIPLQLESGGWTPMANDAVLPWLAAGVAQLAGEFYVVGWGGQVLAVRGRASRREGIARNDAEPVSVIRAVASIGDAVYATGMRRQVYRRMSGTWTAIDAGVLYQGSAIDVGFEALAGFGGDELYAVGTNGAMWSCLEQSWLEIHSPTNVHLHSLCCAADGKVYAGGRKGLMVVGRGQGWSVELSGLDETIWDLHWFGGKLFMLTRLGIYAYEDGEPRLVMPQEEAGSEFVRLASSSTELWAFAHKAIMRYDGITWRRQSMSAREGIGDGPASSLLAE